MCDMRIRVPPLDPICSSIGQQWQISYCGKADGHRMDHVPLPLTQDFPLEAYANNRCLEMILAYCAHQDPSLLTLPISDKMLAVREGTSESVGNKTSTSRCYSKSETTEKELLIRQMTAHALQTQSFFDQDVRILGLTVETDKINNWMSRVESHSSQ